MNAERICRICGKKESEHPIGLVRGDWTHDAEWLPMKSMINPEWEALQDKPHFVPLCCTPDYCKMIEELVRKHTLAVEDLTEKQLAEAIRQAIACGDFQRHVCASNSSQAVIYIPHAREARLMGRIRELEDRIKKLSKAYELERRY